MLFCKNRSRTGILMNLKDISLLRIFIRWFESANNAIEGILQATKNQRHIRFHLVSAFIILLFCFAIGLEKNEFIMITIASLLVIVAEMFNTSIEVVVDILSPQKTELARIAKDIAAGAVLVVSVGALIIGYLILWPYLIKLFSEGFWIHEHAPENIAILAVIINMLIVIWLKVNFGKGIPLRGGLLSGKASILFSILVSISFMTDNRLILLLFLILFILIILGRTNYNFRSFSGAFLGAGLGVMVTVTLFWIFQ